MISKSDNFFLFFLFSVQIPKKKSKTKKSRALNLKIWAKSPANGRLFFRPRLRRGPVSHFIVTFRHLGPPTLGHIKPKIDGLDL